MIRGLHQLHEVLAHHLGIGTGERALHVRVHHALGRHLVLDVMVNQLGIVLRPHPGQRFLLRLGDAQPLKGILDVLGHLRPLGLHIRIGADVGDDVIHVQALNAGAPVRHFRLIINLQGLQPELLHPCGIVLFPGQLRYDFRGQAGLQTVGVLLVVLDVIDASVNIIYSCFLIHRLSPPVSQIQRSPGR